MIMSIKFLLIAFIEKKKRKKEQPKRLLFLLVEEGGLELCSRVRLLRKPSH